MVSKKENDKFEVTFKYLFLKFEVYPCARIDNLIEKIKDYYSKGISKLGRPPKNRQSTLSFENKFNLNQIIAGFVFLHYMQSLQFVLGEKFDLMDMPQEGKESVIKTLWGSLKAGKFFLKLNIEILSRMQKDNIWLDQIYLGHEAERIHSDIIISSVIKNVGADLKDFDLSFFYKYIFSKRKKGLSEFQLEQKSIGSYSRLDERYLDKILQLWDDIEALRNREKKIIASRTEANAKVFSLLNIVDDLNYDNAFRMEEIHGLSQALREKSQDVERLLGQISVLESQNSNLEDDFDHQESQLSSLRDELLILKSAKERLENAVAVLTNTNADLNKERERLLNRVQEMASNFSEEEKSRFIQSIEFLQSQLKQVEDERDRLKESFAAEKKRNDALQIDKEESVRESVNLSKKISGLSEELLEIGKKTEDLHSSLLESEQAKINLVHQVEKLESRLKKTEKDRDQLVEKISTLEKGDSRVKDLSDFVSKLEKELEKSKSDLLLSQKQNKDDASLIASLKRDLEDVRRDNRRLSVDLGNSKKQNSVLDGEKKQLSAKVSDLENQNQKLSEELSSLNETFKEAIAS